MLGLEGKTVKAFLTVFLAGRIPHVYSGIQVYWLSSPRMKLLKKMVPQPDAIIHENVENFPESLLVDNLSFSF